MGSYKLVYHGGTPTIKMGMFYLPWMKKLHNGLQNIPKQSIDKTTLDTRIDFT